MRLSYKFDSQIPQHFQCLPAFALSHTQCEKTLQVFIFIFFLALDLQEDDFIYLTFLFFVYLILFLFLIIA